MVFGGGGDQHDEKEHQGGEASLQAKEQEGAAYDLRTSGEDAEQQGEGSTRTEIDANVLEISTNGMEDLLTAGKFIDAGVDKNCCDDETDEQQTQLWAL